MSGRRDSRRTASAKPVRSEPAGLAARDAAVDLLVSVLIRGRTLDEALAAHASGRFAELEPRDRALARLIAATALRHRGRIDAVTGMFIEKPLPDDCGRLRPILLAAAAQLLFVGAAPHAAINVAVEQCHRDRGARRFARLANAVLRRVSERGAEILSAQDGPVLDIPGWLLARWTDAYGAERARAIAAASLEEAQTDITLKPGENAAEWAARLGGVVLPTGSIRLVGEARIAELDGYGEGRWWVQDAAAALPARLLGEVRGQRIADLCASPGGKTAQLAAAGALVTSVERSQPRIARLKENLARLGLTAAIVEADAATWTAQQPFDAVLVDVPCTATGTIRRHPDILHLRRPEDIVRLQGLQAAILANAARLVREGGLLLYCSCSLEPEEGEQQVARLLADHPGYQRVRIEAAEIGIDRDAITADGDLRTLPCHLPAVSGAKPGIDGFFAARLRRTG